MSGAVAKDAGIVPPAHLAHFVLRTSRFDEMVEWYQTVLNARTAFSDGNVGFLTYDDEHHRVAFVRVPELAPQPAGIAGVHHIAFTYGSLKDLLGNYARLRDMGIAPVWPVNHGPTTSLYYVDPDGNQLEFQVDNFDTVEEAGAFFFTDAFARNPFGVDFDPEALLARLEAGEDEAVLKRRPEAEPRSLDSIPLR